jgi:hypothetical protein
MRKVFDIFMSPGSVTERLHLFVAEYEPRDKICEGGGEATEGRRSKYSSSPSSKPCAW